MIAKLIGVELAKPYPLAKHKLFAWEKDMDFWEKLIV